MKHRKTGRKLNRNLTQRKALFKNLIAALILRGQIHTTEAKAKTISRLIDKLITKAKKRTLQARRLIAAFLPNKPAVNKLVDELTPQLKSRSSGFTTLKRISRRRGDNTVMVEIKLVDSVSPLPQLTKKPKPAPPKPKPAPTQPITPVRPIPVKPAPSERSIGIKRQAQVQKRGTK